MIMNDNLIQKGKKYIFSADVLKLTNNNNLINIIIGKISKVFKPLDNGLDFLINGILPCPEEKRAFFSSMFKDSSLQRLEEITPLNVELYDKLLNAFKEFESFKNLYDIFFLWSSDTGNTVKNCESGKMRKWVKEVSIVIEVISEALYEVYYLEKEYYQMMLSRWEQKYQDKDWLPKNICYEEQVLEFSMFVSVGNWNWYEMNYPIISATYFTNNHTALYQDRSVGWVFDFNEDDIIAMALFDCSCACQDNVKECLEQAFSAGISIEDRYVVTCARRDIVQALLKPEILEEENDYNEIILKGSAKPVGIFIKAEELYNSEDNNKLIKMVSNLGKLDIYVWDSEKNRITVFPPAKLSDV